MRRTNKFMIWNVNIVWKDNYLKILNIKNNNAEMKCSSTRKFPRIWASFIVSSCSGSPNNKDDNKRRGTGNFFNRGMQSNP